MDTPHPTDQRELALALHDLSWWLQRVGPIRAGVDLLSASEVAVLRTVIEHPGCRVSDVADALTMQVSNASAAVRSLVASGRVVKQPDEHDRRVSLLHPTPLALADRDAVEGTVASSVNAALSELTETGIDALRSALPAIRELTAALAASR